MEHSPKKRTSYMSLGKGLQWKERYIFRSKISGKNFHSLRLLLECAGAVSPLYWNTLADAFLKAESTLIR